MHEVAIVVSLAVTVIVVTGISSRLNLPGPLVLIAVGIAGSYVPVVPKIELSPELVLFVLLPPLLYSAALGTSLVDFNANRRPILLLSVALVVFTTLGIGVIVHWLLPGLPWWAAFAIGAVVAPPDAVAATAIGRRIGLPRRIVTILEGESLLNDATALVALGTAIAASTSVLAMGGRFAAAAGGGLVVGVVVAAIVVAVRRQISDPLLDSAVSFVTPFAAYVAAEAIHWPYEHSIHPSGVIAVVVAGVILGHKAPIIQTAQSRIQERMNWSSISFVLESSVFLLIGLQARTIISSINEVSWSRVISVCAAALVGVIGLRLLWTMSARALFRGADTDPEKGVLPWRYSTVVGWAGMRGVVTLAAAFTLPRDTPYRDVLLLIAFVVTAGTLFLQGSTLPWLARRLRVPSPDAATDALTRANVIQQATAAGNDRFAELDLTEDLGVRDQIRDRVEQRSLAAWEAIGAKDEETPSEIYARVRREMIEAERARVLQIRGGGEVPHEVISEVLSMLDVEESMLDYSERERVRVTTVRSTSLSGNCEHLRQLTGEGVEADTPGACGDCLSEGLAWVHLRQCMTCGHVACCDSSPGRHATRHHESSGHPVMKSAEPGEEWRWCFVDEVTG